MLIRREYIKAGKGFCLDSVFHQKDKLHIPIVRPFPDNILCMPLSAYAYTREGDESASESLSRAIRMLSDAARYDETVSELYGQLSEIDSLLNDFNRALSDYMSSSFKLAFSFRKAFLKPFQIILII